MVIVSGDRNHGDRVRPQHLDLWDPFHSWPFVGLLNGGDPNYVLKLPGMILQVTPALTRWLKHLQTYTW